MWAGSGCCDRSHQLDARGRSKGSPPGAQGPEHPHNMAWGDDGKALYLAAQTGLYRIRPGLTGARP